MFTYTNLDFQIEFLNGLTILEADFFAVIHFNYSKITETLIAVFNLKIG